METNKKVSIVIPVYKAADTITRCVESLEKNTYKNLQIILVEDCSGDQTINICKKLANTYDNVLCIENDQNHGVSYTRNQGLDYADGTYLMFVDSDDYVEADYVETMISVISCTGDENIMPVCGYVNHDEKKNGRTDIFLPSNEQKDFKKSIQIMPELYEQRMLQIIWNKIFRLDVIKQNHIRFKEEMFIGEDFRFLLEYMKAAKISGFFFVNKALCHYMRDNENSLMSRLLETKIQYGGDFGHAGQNEHDPICPAGELAPPAAEIARDEVDERVLARIAVHHFADGTHQQEHNQANADVHENDARAGQRDRLAGA